MSYYFVSFFFGKLQRIKCELDYGFHMISVMLFSMTLILDKTCYIFHMVNDLKRK